MEGDEEQTMITIQTNPQMFDGRLPVYTVAGIDKATGLVALQGSDGTSHTVRLDSWGPTADTQPLVGSKVQLLGM